MNPYTPPIFTMCQQEDIDRVLCGRGALCSSIEASSTPPTASAYTPTNGAVGIPFISTTSVTGSPSPTFTLAAGSAPLPLGWTLDPNSGNISGVGLVGGPFSLSISVTNPSGTVILNPVFTFVATAAPTIGTYSPLNVCAGSFLASLVPSSGSPAPTFSITAGTLPAWASLNSSTGTISGTPPPGVAVAFTVTVAATNSSGSVNTVATFNVNTAPTISPYAINSGTVGASFAQPAVGVAGAPAPTFSVTSGALPPGVSLNAGTGALTGNLTTAGNYSFVVTAVNSCGSASSTTNVFVGASLTNLIFFGKLPGTVETDVAIGTLAFADQVSFAGTFNASGPGLGYAYFAIPVSHGVPTSFSTPGPFALPLEDLAPYVLGPGVAFHRSGTINGIAYNVYRSKNASGGNFLTTIG